MPSKRVKFSRKLLGRLKPMIVKIEMQAIYEVEPEIVRWAKWQAGDWIERYKRNPRASWAESIAFYDVAALLGEKIADGTLTQFGIDHIWADPLFPREDPRANKPWDFNIGGFGSIDVKTVPPIRGNRRVMIRINTYQGADYILAIKLLPEIDREKVKRIAEIEDRVTALDAAYDLLKDVKTAVMFGWMTKEQVKSLPIGNFGKARCWWTYLESDESRDEKSGLNPMHEFFNMLFRAKGRTFTTARG